LGDLLHVLGGVVSILCLLLVWSSTEGAVAHGEMAGGCLSGAVLKKRGEA
jgi:hypothetical protein